jgi:hypothetical protein
MENLIKSFNLEEHWRRLTTPANLFNLSLIMALVAMGLILCSALTADAQVSYPFLSLNR